MKDQSAPFLRGCRHCGAANDTPHLVTCAFVQFTREALKTSDTFTHYDLAPNDDPFRAEGKSLSDLITAIDMNAVGGLTLVLRRMAETMGYLVERVAALEEHHADPDDAAPALPPVVLPKFIECWQVEARIMPKTVAAFVESVRRLGPARNCFAARTATMLAALVDVEAEPESAPDSKSPRAADEIGRLQRRCDNVEAYLRVLLKAADEQKKNGCSDHLYALTAASEMFFGGLQ